MEKTPLQHYEDLKTWYVLKMLGGNEFLAGEKEREMLSSVKNELRVAELVKELDIDVWLLKNCDYDNYCRIRTKALESNMQVLDDMNKRESVPLPTRAQFEMLKSLMEGA